MGIYSFYPLIIIHSYCVCWRVPGVGGGWVWTCTVISQLCSRGPYASVRRCIMIIKHTDVAVWFCRWNIKQCRAWCAVMIWWLPSGFWKGRNDHICCVSEPADRCVDTVWCFRVFFSFFGLYYLKLIKEIHFPIYGNQSCGKRLLRCCWYILLI